MRGHARLVAFLALTTAVSGLTVLPAAATTPPRDHHQQAAGVHTRSDERVGVPLKAQKPKPYKVVHTTHPAPKSQAKVSPGVQHLLDDWAGRRLSAAQVASAAMGKLGYRFPVPARYRDRRLTPTDALTLSLAARATVARTPATARRPLTAALASPDPTPSAVTSSVVVGGVQSECVDILSRFDVEGIYYDCHLSSAHFDIYFSVNGSDIAIPDVDGNSDGVNDWAAEVDDTLERAYSTYAGLGYRMPDRVRVAYNHPLALQGRAVTLPPITLTSDGGIFLPRDVQRRYIPAHELFHSVQYQYFPTGLDSRDRILASAVNIGWFMEGSAEWAAKHVVSQDPQITDDARYAYASDVADFLGTPALPLSAGSGTLGGIGGPRNYGSLVFVEWLAERLGQDAVRRVWEQAADDVIIDATSDVIDAIRGYGLDPGRTSDDFWSAAYQLCDGPSTNPQYSYTVAITDPDVGEWCSRFVKPSLSGSGNRPPHASLEVTSTGGTHDERVGGGGASFIDLTAAGTTRGDSRQVTLQVAPLDSDAQFEVRVMGWKSSPADRCRYDRIYPNATSTTYVDVWFDPDCPNATVEIVNSRIEDTDGKQYSLSVAESRLAGAAISSGVVQLGVDASGSIDVPGTVASSGEQTTGLGLRYLPTNADGLSPGCWCEGWGISWTDTDGVQHHDGSNDASAIWSGSTHIVSFTSDGTTATSIVQVDDVLVTHHFHPSPDTHLYQIDVSITPSTSSGSSFTYRRVMDFDAEPTAFDEYMTVQPKDSPGAHVSYSSDDGFAYDDPFRGTSSIDAEGAFTDNGPDDHGALLDYALTPIAGQVGLTLYYGAAGNAADAVAALQAVNADTQVYAKPNTPGNPASGEPNTFIFGSGPAMLAP